RAGTSLTRSSYRAETRNGKTYLIRESALGGSREDLLRNDSMRGRLAGILALDLLAGARMLWKDKNRKRRPDSRSRRRGSPSCRTSRRMRESEGGFMWYRYTGVRGGAFASSPGKSPGVRWQESRATAAWASENET